MKEAFDKAIKRLKELQKNILDAYKTSTCTSDKMAHQCIVNAYADAMEIVREASKEFGKDINVFAKNIRESAIDEFSDKALNFEDYIEPVLESNGVLLYSGLDISHMIVDIQMELKGRENG